MPDTEKTRTRVTKVQLQERLDTLKGFLSSGKATSVVIQIAMQLYKVTSRTAYRYLAKIRKSALERVTGSPHSLYKDVLPKLEYLYAKANQEGNARIAAKALELELKAIDKISNLIPANNDPFFS